MTWVLLVVLFSTDDPTPHAAAALPDFHTYAECRAAGLYLADAIKTNRAEWRCLRAR